MNEVTPPGSADTNDLPALTLVGPERLEEYQRLLRAAYAENERLGVHFRAATADSDEVDAHLRENLAYGFDDDGGRLLGTVSLRMPWGPNPGHLGLPHIGWLATDPARARTGIARTMVEALVQQVLREQLHAPAVSLGTAQDHPWLGSYYRRLGFEPVGSYDLGLGHITDFYVRPVDPIAHHGWRERHAELLRGLSR